jgi:hypothetical protein
VAEFDARRRRPQAADIEPAPVDAAWAALEACLRARRACGTDSEVVVQMDDDRMVAPAAPRIVARKVRCLRVVMGGTGLC